VVYQNMLIDSNIWELPTPASPNRQPSGDATFRLIASTSGDSDMQFSPDGTRIVFCSSRSGHSELWVSNRDGSRVTQLTHFEGGGRVGSPSWSADGKRIAFDAILTGTGSWNLYIVPADGGPVEPLTSDAFNNTRPSWSPDGRWIYFGSNRTGDWQIWRMPSAGGKPEQITWGGGREPVVSWDGRVYYAKPAPIQGIWEVPAEGGREVQIVFGRGRNLNFDVAENGIFMMDTSAKPQATVEMFSFASREIVPVAWLPPGVPFAPSSYLTVTRDGRSMLYVRHDQWQSDIEMLREFR
jgi:Tol biopolymer transport system component